MPHRDRLRRLEYFRIYNKTRRANTDKNYYALKINALTHYGNGLCSCVKCGFSNDLALSIDHINSNGAEHRAKNNMVGSHFYQWLKTNNYPEGYQTLCMNCQFIKRHTNKEAWNQTIKINDDTKPRLL